MRPFVSSLFVVAVTATSAVSASSDCHQASTFLSCDNTNSDAQIQGFDAQVRDSTLFVRADGVVNKDVSGTEISLVLTPEVLGIPLPAHQFDLCQQDGVSCPLKAGDKFAVDLEKPLPVQIPSFVHLDLHVRASSGMNNVFCLRSKVEHPTGKKSGTISKFVVNTNQFGIPKETVRELFKHWIAKFESELPALLTRKELFARFRTFSDNMHRVAFHNAAGHTYTMALNQFAHMSEEEFGNMMLGFRAPPNGPLTSSVPRKEHVFTGSESDLPDTVDWVAKGAVTPVKNQGACGSCWSFATTGAMEGAYFLKNKKLVSFSEEQLVSCDKTDMACNGGLMDFAYQFIEKNGGLCTEQDVPYVSGSGQVPSCTSSCKVVPDSAPKSYVDVQHKVPSLKHAVAQQPVAVAIEADQGAFQFYSGGVLTGRCGTQLDHGVLAVGYGSEDGIDYWKIKNSWGPTWGDEGYIKIQRGNNQSGGECGILLSASYPTF